MRPEDGPAPTPGGPDDHRVLVDSPVALRALAHPVRQRLVDELFAGNVLTATEAAALVGMTPSAVSHHLRILGKYGLARRAEPTEDGRERPWRATGVDLGLPLPTGSARVRAMRSVTRTALASATEELDALLEGRVGDTWTGHRGISRQALWLTREETQELGEALTELVDRFSNGRHTGHHPPGSRRTELTVLFLPLEPPPTPDVQD